MVQGGGVRMEGSEVWFSGVVLRVVLRVVLWQGSVGGRGMSSLQKCALFNNLCLFRKILVAPRRDEDKCCESILQCSSPSLRLFLSSVAPFKFGSNHKTRREEPGRGQRIVTVTIRPSSANVTRGNVRLRERTRMASHSTTSEKTCHPQCGLASSNDRRSRSLCW